MPIPRSTLLIDLSSEASSSEIFLAPRCHDKQWIVHTNIAEMSFERSDVVGCYDCLRGAQVTLSCTATAPTRGSMRKQDPFYNLLHDNWREARLFFSTAIVDVGCSIICPSNKLEGEPGLHSRDNRLRRPAGREIQVNSEFPDISKTVGDLFGSVLSFPLTLSVYVILVIAVFSPYLHGCLSRLRPLLHKKLRGRVCLSRMFTKRYFVSVVTVILGGSAQFYSYGVVNPSQRLISDWINKTYTDRGAPLSLTTSNLIWSFMVSSIAVGAIIGASLTRLIGEGLGRRNGLIANGIVNVFAALLELFSKYLSSPELLIFGRFVFGANMGLTSGLVPMYLMEITPGKYRGSAGTLHQVAVAFSDWFSLLIGLPEVLGGPDLWPLAYAFPGIPALALVLILPFCPESPKYTLSKGDRERAMNDVNILIRDEEQAKSMFESVVREVVLDRSGPGSFKELFTNKELRVPLKVSIIVMIAQQFTGCTAVFAYSTDMFLNANLTPEVARWSTLAIGIVYFLFACTSSYLIDKVGRRPLSLFQLSSCLTALIFLTLSTYLQNYWDVSWASYGSIFALIMYMCVYGTGSPIPWMITGELFDQKFRSTAVTVSVFVAWTFAFIVSLIYLPFQQMVGVSFSYLPFIFGSIISIIFLYILLPETRDRQVEAIVQDFRHRSASLSSLRPWEANRPESRAEMQRLIDHLQRMYSSSETLNEA